MFVIAFACSIGFILTFVLTYYYRYFARAYGIIDIPNSRSSHVNPVPRGAGVAFFIAFNLILAGLVLGGFLSLSYTISVFLGGPIILLVGYWDDLKSVTARLRLGSHFLVSTLIVALITVGFQKEILISFLPQIPIVTILFSIFFIAWFINLYNFMDGCDGLAASIGMVGAGLIAILSFFSGSKDLAIIYLVLAYCLAAFLVFNWHPARVFMGDCGAYYLGYVFGALALVSKLYYDSSLYVHLIIFGAFIVDATWTLIQRLLRGQKPYVAHKEHAFQKLLAKGWGHSRVSAFYVLVTILWLFPMAAFSAHFSNWSFLFLVVAYVPLYVMVLSVKAGRP